MSGDFKIVRTGDGESDWKVENLMTKEYKWTNWNGDKFPLTKDEYEFIERNDLWDGLSEFSHQWNIDEDPGAWDLMMECFIPFMTHGDVK